MAPFTDKIESEKKKDKGHSEVIGKATAPSIDIPAKSLNVLKLMLHSIDMTAGKKNTAKFAETTVFVVCKLRAGEVRSKQAETVGLVSNFTFTAVHLEYKKPDNLIFFEVRDFHKPAG